MAKIKVDDAKFEKLLDSIKQQVIHQIDAGAETLAAQLNESAHEKAKLTFVVPIDYGGKAPSFAVNYKSVPLTVAYSQKVKFAGEDPDQVPLPIVNHPKGESEIATPSFTAPTPAPVEEAQVKRGRGRPPKAKANEVPAPSDKEHVPEPVLARDPLEDTADPFDV